MELRDTLVSFFSSQEQRFWLKAVAPANISDYMMNKATKKMSVIEEKMIRHSNNPNVNMMKL
jgi:hypothetical protein